MGEKTIVNQAKTSWLLGGFFLWIFAAYPAATTQTQNNAQFHDAQGKKKEGFGKEDCDDTSKTLKIKVDQNKAEKIKHYSVKRSSGSSKNNDKLTCNASDTKSLVSLDNFPISNVLPQEICNSTSGSGSKALLCLYADDKKTLIAQIPFNYDTVQPSTPDITEVVEGEQEVKIVFTVSNKNTKDISKANVCFTVAEDKILEQEEECPQEADRVDDLSVTNGSIAVAGLENDVEYAFKIQVKDKSGNQSGWSKIAKGTPTELRTALGEADWPSNPLGFSCSSFGLGGPLWLLWAMYRMRMGRGGRGKRRQTHTKNNPTGKPWLFDFLRINPCIALLTVGFLVSFPVQAAPGRVSLGINGSPYKPNIDKQTSEPVYSRFFGKWLPLMGIETNVHVFDGYGSLQVGPTLNYTLVSGYARKKDDNPSQVKLQLHLYQIRPQLTYVFDPYVHVVPIAPYVRAGFVAMGYVFTFDSGLDRHGQHPAGFVLGWDAGFGLLFLLDGIEPSVSTRAQASGIYRHVYLKTELSYAQIDNFGMGGPLLSPKGMFGVSIPLMATFGLLIEL